MTEKVARRRVGRPWTVRDVLDYNPHVLEFTGEWRECLGTPERHGSILIYGMPKNGKTDFSLKLARYLTTFGTVLYNSREEGMSHSMQVALDRNGMMSVAERFHIVCEDTDELMLRLRRRRAADFIFMDSVQALEMRPQDYRALKEAFPTKLFVYVSHVDGAKNPDGKTARDIKRYSDSFVYVEGYVATAVCRIGGGKAFTIWPEKAIELGMTENKN